jgi:hypothetical protein
MLPLLEFGRCYHFGRRPKAVKAIAALTHFKSVTATGGLSCYNCPTNALEWHYALLDRRDRFDVCAAAGRKCVRSDRPPAFRLKLVRLRKRISRPNIWKLCRTSRARPTLDFRTGGRCALACHRIRAQEELAHMIQTNNRRRES